MAAGASNHWRSAPSVSHGFLPGNKAIRPRGLEGRSLPSVREHFLTMA
jgi:hypothetical protein